MQFFRDGWKLEAQEFFWVGLINLSLTTQFMYCIIIIITFTILL